MKYFLLLILTISSFQAVAQRGDSKSVILSLDRNASTFNGEKTGFNFEGLSFTYQFVNCGGEVQLGINYRKDVRFTSFSFNDKNAGISEIGEKLWPRADEFELQQLEADLYFGNRPLGKVNLDYIVGNFSGCFGETFDVLNQTGQDPSNQEFKENINQLSLRNIQIVRADATGDKRRFDIIEKIKSGETEQEIFRLYKAADVEISLGNFETAKTIYQQANRLKNDPHTQGRISEMERLIREREPAEETGKPEPPSAPDAIASPTTKAVPHTEKQGEGTAKEEPGTENGEAEDTPVDRSARNEVREKLNQRNSQSAVDSRNEALLGQAEAINSQSRRSEQLIDRATSNINSIFQQNIDRINREKRERDAQVDDSYENTGLYRVGEEIKKKERNAEIWRKEQLANKAQARQQRIDAYNAKGGDNNFKRSLLNWRNFAIAEMAQINKYISAYEGIPVSFGTNHGIDVVVPGNNCEYVQLIERIQFSDMPFKHKDVLMRKALNIRFEYYKFYNENAFQDKDWKTFGDDLYWDENYAGCGNYLDHIVLAIGGGFFGYGADQMKYVNNPNTDSEMAQGNHQLYTGTAPTQGIFFTQAIRDIGISSVTHKLFNNFIDSEYDDIWIKFHHSPWNWSKSSPRFKTNSRQDLGNNPAARQQEIDKYTALYDLKRNYRLNSLEDERRQMFFRFHTGDYKEAYNHLQRYVLMEYGNFQGLLDRLKTLEKGQDNHIGISAAVILLENQEFDKALQLTKVLAESNWVQRLTNSDTFLGRESGNIYKIKPGFNPILTAVNKINNRIYYQLGELDKMILPKNEKEYKIFMETVDNEFRFNSRPGDNNRTYNQQMPIITAQLKRLYLDNLDLHLQAAALIRMGNPDLAKDVLKDMVDYYTRNDKNNPRIFYGSQFDIDTFRAAVGQLFRGKEEKIEYRPAVTNLFQLEFDQFIVDVPIIFLSPVKGMKPTNVNTTLIDLSTDKQWSLIKEQIQNHNGSKEALSELFNDLRAIYTGGTFEKGRETEAFLKIYLQLALGIGDFHAAAPAMSQLENDYPTHGLILEKNLIKLMWPHKQQQSLNPNTGVYTLANPARTYFETEVRQNADLLKSLNAYLDLWSSLEVKSPVIPYFYSLYN